MTTGEKVAVFTGIVGTITGVAGLIWAMHKDNREMKMKEYGVYGGAANPWFRGPSENVDMPQGGTDLGPTGVPHYSPMPFWKRTGRL
jgi:hypothetical protein